MKNKITALFMLLASVVLSCKEQPSATEIIPIQDNPAPRLMPKALFADAPDSLFTALGIEEGIPSSVSAFLVKRDGKEILFDAANGAPDSQLLPLLDSCNVTPADIDYIFITHLHGDHIGGLLQNETAAFPNAEVYINRIEYDAWMAMPEEQTAKLRRIVLTYGDRIKTFLPDETLPCSIQAIAAYGHTPGHTAYRIDNNLIAGDLMHGVALQLAHPEFCASFDMDKPAAIQSRKSLIELARKENLRMYGMHFPAPHYL